MFDLGYKQVVINSDSVVTAINEDGSAPATDSAADTILIEGFGKFTRDVATDNTSDVSVPAALGAGAITFATNTDFGGLAVDVTITLAGAPRILSEIFSGGTGDSGQVLVFQTLPVATAGDDIGAKLVSSIIAGFNDKILTFSGTGAYEFAEGYEGLNIARVEIAAAQTVVVPAFTITTTGTEGYGNGKQVEAEVRNATSDNISPYGVQFGGNTAVDVRGKYKTISWSMPSTAASATAGWEPHANLGYGDAQTTTTYGGVKYIAFVNEQATGAIALIDSIFTTPV